MRNIFFPHYLSGEPISTAPLFIGLAVFKQKLNMNKQKRDTRKCLFVRLQGLEPWTL